MSLQKFVKASTVNDLLKKGLINKEGIRVLDCTYSVSQKLDWKRYEQELYGKFDLIHNAPTQSKKIYLSGHIPEAVHMSLDAAMYPSKYERFAMYPPELFEQYVQLLGVDKGEHLILYSRGALGGMMFSSKCAWLFKSYGHDKVSVIDGGFASWQKNNYDISQEDVQLLRGNWTAKDLVKKHNASFDEFSITKTEKEEIFEDTDKTNYLDSRGRAMFDGSEDTGLDPYRVGGSNIPGFKNLPANELLNADGTIKAPEEISKWLEKNGYDRSKPTVTNCNVGLTASFLSYAIDGVVAGIPRLYNGSLKEIELRAPKTISGGNTHLPH